MTVQAVSVYYKLFPVQRNRCCGVRIGTSWHCVAKAMLSILLPISFSMIVSICIAQRHENRIAMYFSAARRNDYISNSLETGIMLCYDILIARKSEICYDIQNASAGLPKPRPHKDIIGRAHLKGGWAKVLPTIFCAFLLGRAFPPLAFLVFPWTLVFEWLSNQFLVGGLLKIVPTTQPR